MVKGGKKPRANLEGLAYSIAKRFFPHKTNKELNQLARKVRKHFSHFFAKGDNIRWFNNSLYPNYYEPHPLWYFEHNSVIDVTRVVHEFAGR